MMTAIFKEGHTLSIFNWKEKSLLYWTTCKHCNIEQNRK